MYQGCYCANMIFDIATQLGIRRLLEFQQKEAHTHKFEGLAVITTELLLRYHLLGCFLLN